MKEQYITFNSITYAHKAKEYLSSRGIKASVVRTPQEMSSAGCGYSLQVNDDANKIANMLSEAGIGIKAIY